MNNSTAALYIGVRAHAIIKALLKIRFHFTVRATRADPSRMTAKTSHEKRINCRYHNSPPNKPDKYIIYLYRKMHPITYKEVIVRRV